MWGIDYKNVLIVLTLILIVVLTLLFILIRRKRSYDYSLELMDGEEFERYCAQLLYQNGFEEIELTPGSHDFGIDIFAQKEGITYAIQCKCYSDTVGIKAVQEAYAGKDYYDKMIGVVMTNQVFSAPAQEFAKKLNVLMWDGQYIEKMVVSNNKM